MQYYFAPMEGITDHIYRSLHQQYFPSVSRYYTPFFSATQQRILTAKQERELPFRQHIDYTLVPQVLTKDAQGFLWFAEQCAERGYTQLDLNLGCPSGTVTAKGKGAGFLREPDALDCFLDSVFYRSPVEISIKTRIGYQDSEQWPRLLEIYNRYPVKELSVHPRVRAAFYNGEVDMEAFAYAYRNSKAPLCYNGNLCSGEAVEKIGEVYPDLAAVMLGRGLVADPGMLTPGGTDVKVLEAFVNALLDAYIEAFGSAKNAMFRMKENWFYLLCHFEDGEKLGKRLRKTTDISEYRDITRKIFETLPFAQILQPKW